MVADGGAGTARPCPCRQEDVVPRLIAAAGIPDRYRHCRRQLPHLGGRRASARSSCRPAPSPSATSTGSCRSGGFRESGLLFVGPPGAGKTHLAVGVLVELIERYRVRGRFVEFTSLLYQIQSTFDPGSPESKRQVLDPLTETELLVLDELGAQQPTPWVRDILYLIINNRYTRRLPTLFTTNYRLEPRPPAAPEPRAPAASSTAGATPERRPRRRDGAPLLPAPRHARQPAL